MDIDEFEEKLDSEIAEKLFGKGLSYDIVKETAQNILNKTSLSEEEKEVVKDVFNANLDFIHAMNDLD